MAFLQKYANVPNLKSKKKKILVQPSIVTFLTQDSQNNGTLMSKSLCNVGVPITQNQNGKLHVKENVSPVKVVDNLSLIVDIDKVVKDKQFYSLDEFKNDEVKPTKNNVCDSHQSIIDSDKSCSDIKTIEVDLKIKEINKLKLDNCFSEKSSKGIGRLCDVTHTYQSLKNNPIDIIRNETITKDFSNHLIIKNEEEPILTKKNKKRVDKNQHINGMHNSDTPNLSNTDSHFQLKTKRAPNEIKTASMVVPVLERNPPIKNLREELISLQLIKPFSYKICGFADCLKNIGLEEVNMFITNDVFKDGTINHKTCFHCGFLTESSLVMGRHLDVMHKKRFKKWPFSSKMDFKKFW